MSPSDHNKTVAVIYTFAAWYLTLPLLIGPPIAYFNIAPAGSRRHDEQVLIVAAALALFLALAVPFHVAAAGLRRRSRPVRKLALVLLPVLLFIVPPAVTSGPRSAS